MVELKHVGRLKVNGRKVLVVFRTLPGDADYCLVVQTENLSDSQHDAIIRAVETTAAQQAYEFGEVLARSFFPDGSTMLPNLHASGRLLKVKTDEVMMTPTIHTSIQLDELNQIIAEQRGCSINDLAIAPETPITPAVEVQQVADVTEVPSTVQTIHDAGILIHDAGILTDEMLANKYRSDANRLLREAEELIGMANELVPITVPVAASVSKPVAKKPVASKKPTTAKKASAKPTTAKKVVAESVPNALAEAVQTPTAKRGGRASKKATA